MKTMPGPRVLQAAKPGNSIGGAHTASSSYSIITLNDFIAETGISNAQRDELWPAFTQSGGVPVGGLMLNTRISRVETSDEDGLKGVSYSNAAGQQIATLRWTDPAQASQPLASLPAASQVKTLFFYGPDGNIKKITAPNGLHTTTRHNFLSMPIETISPDAGKVKMVWTTGGEMAVFQDENLRKDARYKRFEYDRMGREVRAFTSKAPATGGNWPYLYPEQQHPPFYDIYTLTDPHEDLLDGFMHSSDTLQFADAPGYSPGFAFPLIQPGNVGETLIRETRWDFLHRSAPNGRAHPYLSNSLLHSQSIPKLETQQNTVGRPSAAFTYNHTGSLMTADFHSYNAKGQPEWHPQTVRTRRDSPRQKRPCGFDRICGLRSAGEAFDGEPGFGGLMIRWICSIILSLICGGSWLGFL